MRRDLDSSYVRLVNTWQEEDRRAERIQQDRRLQEKINRAGGAVIAVLFAVAMVIAYVGEV